ncbi:MAG: DNA-processing protein DprA [Cytophagales bacterium]|nr:DNA-processing protein DprA [Cytophagales bacterium]
MYDQEKLYQVALCNTPGLGDVLCRSIISHCGSASAYYTIPKHKLSKIPGIGPYLLPQLQNTDSLKLAEQIINTSIKKEVKILFYTDSDYPNNLKRYEDVPALLYCKGNMDMNSQKNIAIVGTRNATEYGKTVTHNIVKELKPYQCTVVSGLAYGIDIAAHKACTDENMQTIGVLGSGVDVIYPAAHKNIVQKMLENGGIISELKFGTKPDSHHFPQRNRTVAAMADVTIVIESSSEGGALITAELANQYHKDVYAVPGNIDRKYSEGCLMLIKNHKATIFTSVADMAHQLGWDTSKEVAKPTFTGSNPDEVAIYSVLKDGELHIDDLSWRAQIPMSKLASLLLNMEFAGYIAILPGKKIKLVNKN